MKVITKRITERRIIAILLLFTLIASYLLFNIFKLCFIKHDYYVQKTFDQVTTSSRLVAERGKIYDSNMNVLAKSETVWRIFVSTKDIRDAEKRDKTDYSNLISKGLAQILSLDESKLYKKLKESTVLDVTIKRSCTEDEYRKVLEYIKSNKLEKLVFAEASVTRSYPEGTLAAHVLGFVGDDNQGLFGLEYYYDDLLTGEDGYYVYAKDASGKALDTEYSSYFPATAGYSIVTTIDSYIQKELEAIIETARANHEVQNRVTGIVMDTASGAILAMATTGAFNPNDPFTLDAVSLDKLTNSGLDPQSEEYKKLKNELLQTMWSNKAISETYEPGSTFKIVTVSAALDAGVAKPTDTFSCSGYTQIGGYKIRCHKAGGHGSGFSLAYGLQMSCNPCMISISERIGTTRFYSYVKKFGFLEKTGIDLPGEATTIFHKEESIGSTELATASFGQRFKVSIINQLTAISAVANGGNLVTPYLVEKVIDQNGNVISDHETDVKRQVISEDVARTVSDILIEGVNGNGGAKNAGVSGYDVAAKTGTSQKFDILDENGNSYLRIGSTVAYANSCEGGISTIIVVDEPTTAVKYGSVVAAPYVSALLEKILPYLEFKTKGEDFHATVEKYVGMSVKAAGDILKKSNVTYQIVGDGDVVLSQTPCAGDVITKPLSKVILYTVKGDIESVTVPSLVGKSLSEAIKLATNSGLSIRLIGNTAAAPSGDDIVTEQSLPPGEIAERGSTISLRAITTKYED